MNKNKCFKSNSSWIMNGRDRERQGEEERAQREKEGKLAIIESKNAKNGGMKIAEN